jgi:hypothetical protein
MYVGKLLRVLQTSHASFSEGGRREEMIYRFSKSSAVDRQEVLSSETPEQEREREKKSCTYS